MEASISCSFESSPERGCDVSQLVEYKCNRGAIRKVALSPKTYLFLILKVELLYAMS